MMIYKKSWDIETTHTMAEVLDMAKVQWEDQIINSGLQTFLRVIEIPAVGYNPQLSINSPKILFCFSFTSWHHDQDPHTQCTVLLQLYQCIQYTVSLEINLL